MNKRKRCSSFWCGTKDIKALTFIFSNSGWSKGVLPYSIFQYLVYLSPFELEMKKVRNWTFLWFWWNIKTDILLSFQVISLGWLLRDFLLLMKAGYLKQKERKCQIQISRFLLNITKDFSVKVFLVGRNPHSRHFLKPN